MPRASSRRSSIAWSRSPRAWSSSCLPRSGSDLRASLATRSDSASDTSRCCAPSWRSRSSLRRASSPACTIRARDSISSCRASADARARATRSANSLRRVSVSGASGWSPPVATITAPQMRPPTVIGALTVPWNPSRCISSAIQPRRPSKLSIRTGRPVRNTCATPVSPATGTMVPTSMPSGSLPCQRPTTTALSPSSR